MIVPKGNLGLFFPKGHNYCPWQLRSLFLKGHEKLPQANHVPWGARA